MASPLSIPHIRRPLRLIASALLIPLFVTSAIAFAGAAGQPQPSPVLTAVDPIDIAQGISITPAPGWRLGDRGPDWVALYNADSSAQMQVAVRPAGGTDVVAALQGDIDRATGSPSSKLTNVRNLSAPIIKPLQSAKFQQKASIDYTADVSGQQGGIPVLGTFSELLNTSSQLSAFIDFRQNNNATPQAAGDGGAMIDSML